MFRAPTSALAAFLIVATALAGCSAGTKEPNQAPRAEISVTKTPGGFKFLLDGSGSSDPEGGALTYAWNWQLGNSSEKSVTADFDPDLGSFTVYASLVVRDPEGRSGAAFIPLTVGANGTNGDPQPAIFNNTPRWSQPETTFVLDARASTDADGDALTYEWIWGPRGNYDDHEIAPTDGSASTNPRTFSTGNLGPGDSWSLRFDEPGTYNYHCHPHPWMKSRVVVDPDLPATANASIVRIRDFAFPDTVRIGVGTNVTFVNEDPIVHTSTVEDYVAGVFDGGDTDLFSQRLDGGDYVVRLIVTDGKGGRGTSTWGLRASFDGPATPTVLNWSSEPNDPLLPSDTVRKGPVNATFGWAMIAQLSWDPPPVPGLYAANFSLESALADGSNTATINECVAVLGSGPDDGSAFMNCELAPLDEDMVYQFNVRAQSGAVPSWTLTFSGIPYSTPGFGDSVAGPMHHH